MKDISRDVKKKKRYEMKLFNKILLTAAIGMSLMAVTGCGTSSDPKSYEGVYKKGDITCVLKYDKPVEYGSNDKRDHYKLYRTQPGYEFKGKTVYTERPFIKDKDNNVVDQGVAKAIYGKIDGDKFVITGDGYISKGEYIKTKDKMPSDQELDYSYRDVYNQTAKEQSEKKIFGLYSKELKKLLKNEPK